jgi:hypothetical protein
MKVTGGMRWEGVASHWRNQFAVCPVVKLDGKVINHVTEADDVAGYVIVECYGPNNKLLLDESRKNIKTERRNGRVEISGRRGTSQVSW